MAYFSLQCIGCKDRTKRCAGEYRGVERKGKQFSGQMYQCDNKTCNINIERMRGKKQLRMLEAKKYED